MKLIVIAYGYELPYHAVRLAQRAGHEVHVLGLHHARGFRLSRACRSYHALQCVPGTASPSECAREIADWVQRIGAAAVMPSDILSFRLLSAIRRQLPVPVPPLPAPALFDRLNDKGSFFELCSGLGLAVPETCLLDSYASLLETMHARGWRLPLIVKPVTGMSGDGVRRITDARELAALSNWRGHPLLVQRMVIGRDCGISILASQGRIRAHAEQQRTGNRYDFSPRPALREMVETLVSAVAYDGIAHFDAIEEDTTGRTFLIECNPRNWYSIFTLAAAGLNMVEHWLTPSAADNGTVLTAVQDEVRIGRDILRGPRTPSARWMRRYLAGDPVGWLAENRHVFCDDEPGRGSVQWQLEALAELISQNP